MPFNLALRVLPANRVPLPAYCLQSSRKFVGYALRRIATALLGRVTQQGRNCVTLPLGEGSQPSRPANRLEKENGTRPAARHRMGGAFTLRGIAPGDLGRFYPPWGSAVLLAADPASVTTDPTQRPQNTPSGQSNSRLESKYLGMRCN